MKNYSEKILLGQLEVVKYTQMLIISWEEYKNEKIEQENKSSRI